MRLDESIVLTSSSGTPKFLRSALALLSLSFLRSPSVPMTFLYLLPAGRLPGDSRCNHGNLNNMFKEDKVHVGVDSYLSG